MNSNSPPPRVRSRSHPSGSSVDGSSLEARTTRAKCRLRQAILFCRRSGLMKLATQSTPTENRTSSFINRKTQRSLVIRLVLRRPPQLPSCILFDVQRTLSAYIDFVECVLCTLFTYQRSCMTLKVRFCDDVVRTTRSPADEHLFDVDVQGAKFARRSPYVYPGRATLKFLVGSRAALRITAISPKSVLAFA